MLRIDLTKTVAQSTLRRTGQCGSLSCTWEGISRQNRSRSPLRMKVEMESAALRGIDGELSSLDRLVRKFLSSGTSCSLSYEAGPCGCHLYPHLRGQGCPPARGGR